MGSDKALVSFAGRPLVARALDTLGQAGLMGRIAGARSSLTAFGPVIGDAEPGLGPLAGVCAALGSTSARYAVFLPVDLPLLPPSLVRFLLHHARIAGDAVTVSAVNGFAQTFPAVVDRGTLPALKDALKEGHGGCFQAFKAAASGLVRPFSVVSVEMLVQCGQVSHPDALPATYWFCNVNTREELERAERRLGHSGVNAPPTPYIL